jgi:hypothetical protein
MIDLNDCKKSKFGSAAANVVTINLAFDSSSREAANSVPIPL